MHLIEDVLRLHHECGRSQREVARSCGVSLGTVNRLLRKAEAAGLGWPLPEGLDEEQLQPQQLATISSLHYAWSLAPEPTSRRYLRRTIIHKSVEGHR